MPAPAVQPAVAISLRRAHPCIAAAACCAAAALRICTEFCSWKRGACQLGVWGPVQPEGDLHIRENQWGSIRHIGLSGHVRKACILGMRQPGGPRMLA